MIVSDSQTVTVAEPIEKAGEGNTMSETQTTSPAVPQHPVLPVKKRPASQSSSVSVVSESPAIAEAIPVIPECEPASTPKHSDLGPQPEKRVKLSKDIASRKKRNYKKHAEGWSFGIGAGSGKMVKGLDGFGNNDFLASNPEPPVTDPENPDDPDKPELERAMVPLSANTLPQLRSTSYEYVHRMPLSVGVSVKKNITDDFGLESGLSYTFLYSDIKQSGATGYVGSQRIHYLGIPVKANWTFYRKGVFSMYVSGGVLTEYSISARRRLKNEYIKLNMNRWQFSMNASVGAEVKLVRPLSLYLEPGVGYYFDNGNDIPTVRKEHPWLFGLQLGLRFSY